MHPGWLTTGLQGDLEQEGRLTDRSACVRMPAPTLPMRRRVMPCMYWCGAQKISTSASQATCKEGVHPGLNERHSSAALVLLDQACLHVQLTLCSLVSEGKSTLEIRGFIVKQRVQVCSSTPDMHINSFEERLTHSKSLLATTLSPKCTPGRYFGW